MTTSIVNIKNSVLRLVMRHLFSKFKDEFNNLDISEGFKALNVFNGWHYFADDWQVKRLDSEVYKNKDFVVVHDIKYKLNYVSISYTSKRDLDYDHLIDSLFNNN